MRFRSATTHRWRPTAHFLRTSSRNINLLNRWGYECPFFTVSPDKSVRLGQMKGYLTARYGKMTTNCSYAPSHSEKAANRFLNKCTCVPDRSTERSRVA